MSSRLFRWFGILCLAAVLGSLAAACGGGDGDDDGGDGGDAARATVPASGPGPTESTDEGPAEGADALDPCALVTGDEATQALGAPAAEPERTSIADGFQQCIYGIEGGQAIDGRVVIHVRGETSRDDFERLVDENTPEELGVAEPIDGLGDAAYQHLATYILDGDVMVVVTVAADNASEETQQEMARTALGRLP